MQNNLKAALLAALLLAPTASFAQEAATEEESNFSWNLGIVTDYVFRGISQSDSGEAFQGGLDYSFGDSGFYTGTWWSTVNYGANAQNNEVDLFVGYGTDLGDKFNVDVMLVRYSYFGEGNDYSNIDYNEIITKFGMVDVATLTIGYTNDYSNSGEDATYVSLGNSWDLGKDYSLNASFGRSYYESGSDINDWNVGISKAFGPVELGLNYYDTNLDEDASDSVVFSFKIGG